jgi:hypothetical protein
MHTESHFSPKISVEKFMKDSLKQHIVEVCNQKIAKKGLTVGISFYAFFANKNNNPQLLMEVAEWWIITHQLDHFEKAVKIKKLIQNSD